MLVNNELAYLHYYFLITADKDCNKAVPFLKWMLLQIVPSILVFLNKIVTK